MRRTEAQPRSDPDSAKQLADALESRLALIADADMRRDNPEAQLAGLRAASEKIDSLAARFSGDPKLAHYLERRSLDKALAHLREHYLSA